MLLPRLGSRQTLDDIARIEQQVRSYDQLPEEIRRRVRDDPVRVNTELIHWLLGRGITEDEIALNWKRIQEASEKIDQRRYMGLPPMVDISIERIEEPRRLGCAPPRKLLRSAP